MIFVLFSYLYYTSMNWIKNWSVGLILLFSLGSFSLQKTGKEEGVKWYDWNEGVVKARNEGKIALIDTYTDWCHWCKVMDRNTYANPAIIELINRDFVAIKFNPELDRKYVNGTDTLNGRQLLSALSGGSPGGYPTTYFYLTKKNVMYQEAGYIEPVKFEGLLKEVLAEHAK